LPRCIGAGVIRVENGVTYERDGEVVKRFGFLHRGRHFLATFLTDEQENPAVVQAIMRHARWRMGGWRMEDGGWRMEDGHDPLSHSRRKAKRAAQKKVFLRPILEEMRVSMREPETMQ
jgi:hypothetical protein